jgi:arylformamidase
MSADHKAEIYDVTVALSEETPVYPGDPPVELRRILSLASGDVANVSHLSCGTHTGTHIDPPSHFLADGMTLDELPLDVLLGPCRVVDAGEVAVIDRALVEGAGLDGVERVLFKTRNSRFWHERREFAKDYVYLAPEAAHALVAGGARLVGIDYLSIERPDFERPETHLALLERGVVIVEGLDLSAVEAGTYELICLPLRIRGGDGAPARVILRSIVALEN